MQLHQIVKLKEEYAALRQQRDTRAAREPAERSACLMAACPATCLHGQPASAFELEEIGSELILGTLDLYAVRAMPGEVLIGEQPAHRGSEKPLLSPTENTRAHLRPQDCSCVAGSFLSTRHI